MARGRKKGKHSWDGYSKKDQASKWLRTLAEAHYQLRRSDSSSAGATAAGTNKASTTTSKNESGGWLQQFRLRHQRGGSYRSGAGAVATRVNSQAAARFVELYLRGPPSAAAANLTSSVAARGRRKDGVGCRREGGEEEEDISLEDWLCWETRRCVTVDEAEETREVGKEGKGKEASPILSLTELCCRQVGADLPFYGAACALDEEVRGGQGTREQGAVAAGAPEVAGVLITGENTAAAHLDDLTGSVAATSLSSEQGLDSKNTTFPPCTSAAPMQDRSYDDKDTSSQGEEGEDNDDHDDDDEEEEEEAEQEKEEKVEDDYSGESTTADAIRGIFSLLPSQCLARISLAASLSHAITDASLPLLCQPSALQLVLVGSFTDSGLARAIFPRLGQLSPTASWEDTTQEPQLGGCVLLQSLLVSSPGLTPQCVEGIGRHLTTVRRLALPRCFNADVTTTAKEVLSVVGASCGYVQELDLRGCHWLSEKSLVGWVNVGGKAATAAAAMVGIGGIDGRGGKEGEGRRVVVGGSEGRNKGMARVLEFDGPTADRGPPAALRRLYLDKRLANAEVVRRAFAEVGGDCERGSGSRETTGVIEVSVWEAEEKKLLD
eukprot:evm.model.NODE_9677_length_9592_cov_31.903254.5